MERRQKNLAHTESAEPSLNSSASISSEGGIDHQVSEI